MDMPVVKSEDLYMEILSQESSQVLSLFSCGNEVIDEYFKEKASSDPQNVCYLYRNRANDDVVGAAAICCSGINIGNKECPQLSPAIKIDYFAISESYQDIKPMGVSDDEHFYVSDQFICTLIAEILKISECYVGASYIILYSVPDAIHFYDRNEFAKFEDYMNPESCLYLDGCSPMYMPL